MAPVDGGCIPVSPVPPVVQQYKILNKVLELPLVFDTFNEAKKLGSYYLPPVEQTVAQLSPYVETVASTVKAKVSPDIVKKYNEAVEKVSVVTKDVTGNLDTMACEGLDKLTDKVPLLKEPTAKVIETTKNNSSSWINGQLIMVQKFLGTDVATTKIPGYETVIQQVNTLKDIIMERFKTEAKLNGMDSVKIMETVTDITNKMYSLIVIRAAGILPENITLFVTKGKTDKKEETEMVNKGQTKDANDEETKNSANGLKEKSSTVNVDQKKEFGKMGERKAILTE